MMIVILTATLVKPYKMVPLTGELVYIIATIHLVSHQLSIFNPPSTGSNQALSNPFHHGSATTVHGSAIATHAHAHSSLHQCPASAPHSASNQHYPRTSSDSSHTTCITDLPTAYWIHDCCYIDCCCSALPTHSYTLDSMTTVLDPTDRCVDRSACNSTSTGNNTQRCCRRYIHSYPSDTITIYLADTMICDSVLSHWPNLPTFDLLDCSGYSRSLRE